MESFHKLVQQRIVEICNGLGLDARPEFKGKDWRADIMVESNGVSYAFEIQTSRQTLKRTKERQEKYIRDGVVGCWLFEKDPAGMMLEMMELPIFKIEYEKGELFVSLKNRKTLPLHIFITDFINGKIKFCQTIKPLPEIEIKFVEFVCWNCGLINHIHYVAPLKSSCGAYIYPDETMWSSDKFAFHPEILKKIGEYAKTEKGQDLALAVVKERYSRTMHRSYMSFGCLLCDSIFGDFYIHELMIDDYEGESTVEPLKFQADFPIPLRKDIPHWCHPGNHPFCDDTPF